MTHERDIADRDSGEATILPPLQPGGGAGPSQLAPPASTEQRQTSFPARARVSRRSRRPAGPPVPASLLNARMQELFWSQPDPDRLAEAQARIDRFLSAALAPKVVQLFDDVYESKAC